MHQPVFPGMFSFIPLRLATLVNASQPSFLQVEIDLECSVLMFVFFILNNSFFLTFMTEPGRSTNCYGFRKWTDLYIRPRNKHFIDDICLSCHVGAVTRMVPRLKCTLYSFRKRIITKIN